MPAESFLLGQIGDPLSAIPDGSGAALWWLNPDSFGVQAASTGGDARLLAFETDDIALPTTILRRIRWPCVRSGAATIRLSPTINLNRPIVSKTIALPDLGAEYLDQLVVRIAKRCNAVRLKVEVLECTGRFAVFPTFTIDHRPLALAVPAVDYGVTA